MSKSSKRSSEATADSSDNGPDRFNEEYYFGQMERGGFDGSKYKYDHPDQQWQLNLKRTHLHQTFDSILFVGCGPGFEVRYFREVMGKKAFGYDVSEFAIDWIQKNSPTIKDFCKVGDGKAIPFDTDCVDVVAAFDCMVLCPAKQRPELISEMCRVAKQRIIFRAIPHMPHRHPADKDGWHGIDGVMFRYEPYEYWVGQFEKSGKFVHVACDRYPNDPNTHVFRFERK